MQPRQQAQVLPVPLQLQVFTLALAGHDALSQEVTGIRDNATATFFPRFIGMALSRFVLVAWLALVDEPGAGISGRVLDPGNQFNRVLSTAEIESLAGQKK